MPVSRAAHRGSLLAAGGREADPCDPSILEEFVRRCGGASACILVLTAASSHPKSKRIEYGAAFGALGVTRLTFLHHRSRGDAEASLGAPVLDEADGVFLCGGNQLKLVTTLGGTRLLERLRERYRDGLHVAGTSAGAAALSSVMIARGRARAAPRLASIRLAPGLGLLPEVIVDQHFSERDRLGRLMTAVLCNASMLGFGIDENTAFVVEPDDRVTVIGQGTVTVVDGSELVDTNLHDLEDDRPAAFTGLRVHGLGAGWAFDLKTRRVEQPLIEEEEEMRAGESVPPVGARANRR